MTYAKYEWPGIGITFRIFIGFLRVLLGVMYCGEKKRLHKLRLEK